MADEWRNPARACNVVRDWTQLQGMTHVTDEHIQIRRDVDTRLVSIENAGLRKIGVAITTYFGDPLPVIRFIMESGEVKSIGINSIGSPMQYIHLLDPVTGLRSGPCTSFRTDANQFVLRDGENAWFVQPFQRTGYRAGK